MPEIAFPSDTREITNAIRGAIGRAVYFYHDDMTECTACKLDPITNTSTNPYCVVCSGQHFIHSFKPTTISGHVTWAPSETMHWTQGGQYNQYSCRVQIEFTPGNISVLDKTIYVIVDDKQLRVEKSTLRGVPEINRVLLDLIEL